MEHDDGFVEIPGRIPKKYLFKVNYEQKARERSGPQWFSEVKSEPIDWLWEPYIPLGRLTMLGGDPGAGKSFITTAIAAALSKGDCFPGDPTKREPGNTLMLAVEDGPADTIMPRLVNLKADLTRIAFSVDDIVLDEEGLKVIREWIKITKARLVIIDPIVAFLGPKMDMNRANEVRHIMKAIASIAKEMNVAVLVVRHNRKEYAGATGKAIYAGMGSIDFTASVRSELAVNESKNGVKFFNHIKANSGRKGQSLTYNIITKADGSGLFEWGEFTAWPPHTEKGKAILSTKFKDDGKIKLWIHDQLKDHPDGVLASEMIERARMAGYEGTKLERARKGVVLPDKIGKVWYWKLDPTSRPMVD